MARPSTKDPLDKFRWEVNIEPQGGGEPIGTRFGFTSVDTPEVAITTKNYAEGGNHLFPKKIIDSVEYRPVTLTRGVTSNIDFHKWVLEFIELFIGKRQNVNSNNFSQSDQLPPDGYRRTIRISHKDRIGRTIKEYILHNAFPIEYKPASNFASDGDDTVSIEKLVIVYESFEVNLNKNLQPRNPYDPKDIIKRTSRRVDVMGFVKRQFNKLTGG